MAKRQKYIEGSFLEIPLENKKKVFGRLYPNYKILVYDYLLGENEEIKNFEVLENKKIITGNGIYKDIITKGLFKIIGYKELNEADYNKFPILFTQEIGNYKECSHVFINKEPILVSPKDCSGLEASSIWEATGLIKLINDYYAGRKNASYEYHKVILDETDLRANTPFYRWNEKKQKIVAFDPKTNIDID